jgi:hypothetical protein
VLFTVNVSVIATAGTTDVFNFQLLSNTGTFPLLVHVFFVAAVPRLALSAGVYHKAVVTSVLFIHVINQESLVKSETFVGNTFQLSLISFQVFPSNNATFPSTAQLGQTTSPLHSPSAPSDTLNTVVSQSVSVIVIVCTFQEVVSVIVEIQFPVAHVGHCGQVGQVAPVGHCGQVSHCSPCGH